MRDDAVVGFWSYTHEDDELDGGSILKLSRLVMEEYNLLSGEPLNLFVDRNDIAWGQGWRTRIDASLAEATFFIPIITPRYFTRPECRRELLEFAAKAEILGANELLLPILYVEVSGFSTESSDEAVALIARTQYVDWRKNRLLEPSSREYRIAVNALARRLLDIARYVADVQLKRELESDPDDDGADGIVDVVTRIENLLPDWLEAVMVHKSINAQVLAVWGQYERQMDKLRRRKAQPSALLSTQIRMAQEMLPLAERAEKDSQVYLARSVELDPFISALSRLVAEHPDSFPLVAPVREAIDEAMEAISEFDRGVQSGRGSVQESLRKMSHLGRIMKRANAAFAGRYRNGGEGNDIVRRWDVELIDHNSNKLGLPVAGNTESKTSDPQ
jgi:TIR domain